MTGDDLEKAGIELYGRRGWAIDLAAFLGVDPSTVYRYTHNPKKDVPGPVAAAVRCALQIFKLTKKLPK